MSQASLFDEPMGTSSKSIDEKFWAFHAAHRPKGTPHEPTRRSLHFST